MEVLKEEPEAIMEELCPNCGKDITVSRIKEKLFCPSCLPEGKEIIEEFLLQYKEVYNLNKELEAFKEFFKRALGRDPWSLQETWSKKFLRKESFAIFAPTGLGKTVFGIIASLYIARNNGRALILAPTSLLAEQIYLKILDFMKNLGETFQVIRFHAGLKKREKEDALKRIHLGEFNLLIVTTKFLTLYFSLLENKKFDFIFVDDVDSLLKRSKNVDKVLILLGFSRDIIEKALDKLVKEERLSTGRLLVSGSTIRAKRTKRLKLFQNLLGFDVSLTPTFIRNIEDLYHYPKDIIKEALEFIKILGRGGLIFIPSAKGKEFLLKVNDYLLKNGIKSYPFIKSKPEILDKFVKGEYDVLLGICSSRSPLVRGIDLPKTVRYALFLGIPRIEVKLSPEAEDPKVLLILLKTLRNLLLEESLDKVVKLDKIILKLRRCLLQRLEDKSIMDEVKNFLKEFMKEEFLKKIRESEDISVREERGELYLIIPDAVAYIQASGRTSRLYAGGISKGLSLLLVDDDKAFKSLKVRLKWYLEESRWSKLDEVNLQSILKEIDKDRELIEKASKGELREEEKELIKSALMVVESPNKAKYIALLFGKPAKRRVNGLKVYDVLTEKFLLTLTATGGHILELITHEDKGYYGILEEENSFKPIFGPIKKCLSCGEDFISSNQKFCPYCKSEKIKSKMEVIKNLRKLALESNLVLIGTDPDMEGEKIAWDLSLILLPYNKFIYRVTFHEVTRRGLKEALQNLKEVDVDLVKAQLVRRIEDRWVGFELSRRLWEKFNLYTLSAGRVQTPVLGWIIERYNQFKKKKNVIFIELENGLSFKLEKLGRLDKEYLEALGSSWELRELSIDEIEKSPFPPFTTDEMLRVASSQQKIPSSKVMQLAQELFELGLITYHRTDSTRVSAKGIEIAKEYIMEKWKDESLFKARSWELKEGAHECIRPTKPIDSKRLNQLIKMGIYRFPKKLTQEHLNLYNLIFNRFIASQMTEAKFKVQKLKAVNEKASIDLEIPFSLIKEGFTKLLNVKLSSYIKPGKYKVKRITTRKVPLAYPYTEGELVKEMRERGIGRPSTYAKIIETLKKENYVVERKNLLFPTKLGVLVYNYLSKRFQNVVSEELTRRLEDIIEEVKKGKLNYLKVLKEIREEVKLLRN